MTVIELATILLWLFAIFFIPGWAFISVFRIGDNWPSLHRWIFAIALSIAFFPILFYFSRLLLPDLHIGRNKLVLMFLVFIGLIFSGQWKRWKNQFAFNQLELIALVVFIVTIFVRFSLAYRYPFPAWSDSLHHTLITQLTALNGQLPYSLAPYEPSVLNMYHLGLYSLTGTLQILSGMAAHTALLWTAQLMNGLCGIGIYFVLDRLVGRRAGIIGALVVGLYSFQPNWYFNWGRFTQLSSQTIMLIAWLFTWESVRILSSDNDQTRRGKWGFILASGVLNASVFLLHFRVAGYYLPLLMITLMYELGISIKNNSLSRKLVSVISVGALSIVLISPVLLPSFKEYVQSRQPSAQISTPVENPPSENEYYDFNLDTVFAIGARKWMLWLAGFAALISLIFYPRLTLGLVVWMAFLWAEGNAFRLGIPLLSFTNYTAIMIMYYIPIGMVLGMAGEAVLNLSWLRSKAPQAALFSIFLVLGVIAGQKRMEDIESLRFFTTPADVEAMDWIRSNTDEGAMFGINTYMWLGSSPHGTDGGYWIPYFTNRKTTAGTMLYSLADAEYIKKILKESELIVDLAIDPEAVSKLGQLGVEYIYIGPKGNFNGHGLNPEIIRMSPNAELVFSQNDVEIFKIIP